MCVCEWLGREVCTCVLGCEGTSERVEVRACQCLPSTAVGGRVPCVRAYVYCVYGSACACWVFARAHIMHVFECMYVHLLRACVFYACVCALHACRYTTRMHPCVRVCFLCLHTCICLHVHVYVCMQA